MREKRGPFWGHARLEAVFVGGVLCATSNPELTQESACVLYKAYQKQPVLLALFHGISFIAFHDFFLQKESPTGVKRRTEKLLCFTSHHIAPQQKV